ncbi:MAG TPA: TRIC cation channel family protein [Burkholderiales bacterium]|nr:TRIC cation channel family protein [Burkholderiales bacterium]
MPGVSFLLPIEFDLAATFLAAIAATWAASRRGYDIVGLCVLAFVGSIGGGLLRDSVFIMQIPVAMQHPEYLWAILAAVTVGVLTFRYAERFVHLFAYTDALALGVYGIYGANRALIAGLSPEGAVIVGLCNAVGGGLMRDILVREEPILFKPGQLYTLAALAGVATFVVLSHAYGVDTFQAAWISIFVTALLRLLSIRFNWTTRAVRTLLRLP